MIYNAHQRAGDDQDDDDDEDEDDDDDGQDVDLWAKMELATARWNLHSTTFVHPDDAAVVYNDQKLMVGYSSKFTLLYLNKEWVLLKGLTSVQFHLLNKSGKVCLIHFQKNVLFWKAGQIFTFQTMYS